MKFSLLLNIEDSPKISKSRLETNNCSSKKPPAPGSAYGIAMSIYNLFLGSGANMVGVLTYKDLGVNKYFWVHIFLASAGCIALLTSVWLLLIDGKNGNQLLNHTVTEDEGNEDKSKITYDPPPSQIN